MNTVLALAKVTKELYELVQKEGEKNERETFISRIDELLEEREVFISQIQPPFTEQEKQLGHQIISWNQEIDSILKLVLSSVQVDIKGVNDKKKSVHKYANPYEALQSDGAFYDKKN